MRRFLLLGRTFMTNTDNILKSRDSTFLTKFHIVKAVIFLVVMHECESWTILKAEHWRIVVLDKTVESPLECEEIKPINPKGNQPWTFIGRTDAGAEVPILWPPDAKSRIIGKDPDAGKDWRQQEKGAAEDVKMGRNLSKLWEIVKDRESWCAAVPGVSKSWTRLNDWTTTTRKAIQMNVCAKQKQTPRYRKQARDYQREAGKQRDRLDTRD